MFVWLNKRGVKSNKGFEVQIIGRFEIEYRDNGKVLTIDFEPGVDGDKMLCLVSKSNFFKWDDGTPINEEEQKEMINNFTEAMEFQNLGVVVD